jgi:hypothetical protein
VNPRVVDRVWAGSFAPAKLRPQVRELATRNRTLIWRIGQRRTPPLCTSASVGTRPELWRAPDQCRLAQCRGARLQERSRISYVAVERGRHPRGRLPSGETTRPRPQRQQTDPALTPMGRAIDKVPRRVLFSPWRQLASSLSAAELGRDRFCGSQCQVGRSREAN